MTEEQQVEEIPEEESTRYALLITVFGGLLTLLLVGILFVTLFTAWETSAAKADEPEAVAMGDGETAATAAEAADEEATTDEAAHEDATTEEAAADDDAAHEEAATDEEAAAEEKPAAATNGPSAEVVTALSKATCTACHIIPDVPGAVGMVGPDLSTIGVDGATRVSDMSAEEYIHESIVDPEAYLALECPTGTCAKGLMTPAFGQMLTAEELDSVVAYLSTLGQ